MSTRSLIRIFVSILLTTAALPLAAWEYSMCINSKITWGSDSWVDFKAANVSFPVGSPRLALGGAVDAWNFAPGYPFTFAVTFENLTAATTPNFSNEIIFASTGFDDEYATA